MEKAVFFVDCEERGFRIFYERSLSLPISEKLTVSVVPPMIVRLTESVTA